MPKAVFVVLAETPGGVRVVGRATSGLRARQIAEEWGGGVDWLDLETGVTSRGERVVIEIPPHRSRPAERPLEFPRWDYVLDSRAFERYLAPELGLPLNRYDEVADAARRAFHPAWVEMRRWLDIALGQKGIDPGHPETGAIYPSDAIDLADWALESGEIWGGALSSALRAMVEAAERG